MLLQGPEAPGGWGWRRGHPAASHGRLFPASLCCPVFPWTYRAGTFQRGMRHSAFRGWGIRLVLGLYGEPCCSQHPRELDFVLTVSFSSSFEKSVIASSHKLLPALPFYHLQPFSCDTGPINLVRTISPYWVLGCLARLFRLLHHLLCFLWLRVAQPEWKGAAVGCNQTLVGGGGCRGSWRWMGFGTQGWGRGGRRRNRPATIKSLRS